jgi:hypothetical protein
MLMTAYEAVLLLVICPLPEATSAQSEKGHSGGSGSEVLDLQISYLPSNVAIPLVAV